LLATLISWGSIQLLFMNHYTMITLYPRRQPALLTTTYLHHQSAISEHEKDQRSTRTALHYRQKWYDSAVWVEPSVCKISKRSGQVLAYRSGGPGYCRRGIETHTRSSTDEMGYADVFFLAGFRSLGWICCSVIA
jgi:hypothetical protein